jgi:hypothetical protein
MVRCLLLVYVLLLLQCPARADEGRRLVGQSPCVILVHDVDKTTGSLVFRQAETNFELREAEETVLTTDGKFQIRIYREVGDRPRQVALSLKDTKVYDRTGMLLDEAEILRRVKPGMQVVIARGGDKIGLDYVFVFKKETLILVLPKHHEVPRPEPLPVSILGSVLESVATRILFPDL